MLTSKMCLKKYGDPEKESAMVLWDVPKELEIGSIPKKIYCNQELIRPLEVAFTDIINRGLVAKLKTWDGCFNIRKKKGGTSLSLHAWGIAIDINAAWNGYGKPPSMNADLMRCFRDAGFDWGGDWKVPDGMHFQLGD